MGMMEMETPDWMGTRRKKLEEEKVKLPKILHHTLLSSKEIISCLDSLGGIDTELIAPIPELLVDGIIITTGITTTHNRHLAQTLVRILRDRKLQECGVIGAKLGAEGGTKDIDDDWIVVDCGSFAVHIMDEYTRRSLNLEDLWDPIKREEREKKGYYYKDHEEFIEK